jgi:hypothetical protein
MTAVSVAADHVRVLWRGPANASGSPVVGGGAVWVVDWHAGKLYELNQANGQVRYQLYLGSSLPTSASPSLSRHDPVPDTSRSRTPAFQVEVARAQDPLDPVGHPLDPVARLAAGTAGAAGAVATLVPLERRGPGLERCGEGPGGAGQVVRDAGQDQPGGVRGELADGRWAERAADQVCEHLLDDREAAGAAPALERGVGEHGVVAAGREQLALAGGGLGVEGP